MSIYSSVYVSKDKAKKMVKEKLMDDFETIVNLSVLSMSDSDLMDYLNKDDNTEFYYIEREKDE